MNVDTITRSSSENDDETFPTVRNRHRCCPDQSLTFVLLLALVYAPTLHAASVVVQPTKDNTIYDGSVAAGTLQNNTCGAGPDLFAGTNNSNPPKARCALLAFDIVCNIPPGATINAGTLTVMFKLTPDGRQATMTLHPLTRDWGEGTL